MLSLSEMQKIKSKYIFRLFESILRTLGVKSIGSCELSYILLNAKKKPYMLYF